MKKAMNCKITFDYTDKDNPKITADISEVIIDIEKKSDLALKDYLDKIPRFTVDIEKHFIKKNNV